MSNPDALSQAIIYATDHGADVISMSIGSRTLLNSYDEKALKAIDYALSKGVVLLGAVGNLGDKSEGATMLFLIRRPTRASSLWRPQLRTDRAHRSRPCTHTLTSPLRALPSTKRITDPAVVRPAREHLQPVHWLRA